MDTESHLSLMRSVWFCSLRCVNGYWEMLGSGPLCHILALEEGLKAILHIFEGRYGDMHLCACSYPCASNAECSILHSVASMVQIGYL